MGLFDEAAEKLQETIDTAEAAKRRKAEEPLTADWSVELATAMTARRIPTLPLYIMSEKVATPSMFRREDFVTRGEYWGEVWRIVGWSFSTEWGFHREDAYLTPAGALLTCHTHTGATVLKMLGGRRRDQNLKVIKYENIRPQHWGRFFTENIPPRGLIQANTHDFLKSKYGVPVAAALQQGATLQNDELVGVQIKP